MGFLSNIFNRKVTRPKEYNSATWFDYAQRQEKRGNYQEAADCYEIIVKHSPAHLDAYYQLFQCLEKTKQWEKMMKYAKQFNDTLGYYHYDWGDRAILTAQQYVHRKPKVSVPQSQDQNRDNKAAASAKTNEANSAVPKQGIVITTKSKNGNDVKEVTWVDVPETQEPVAVEEEAKSKAKWPDKADFMPRDDGKKSFGAKYDSFCSKFPPYKFFEHEPRIPQTVIEQHQDFIQVLADVKVSIAGEEEAENYQSAADCCEVLTQGECWEPWPYTKLMEIYQKAGLNHEAEELRQYAIDFFTKRRANMEQQILQCTEQQDELEIIKQQIENGKPIRYYRGLFYLYNPYPCIEEWKAMGDLSQQK